MGTAVYENFEETEQFVLGALTAKSRGYAILRVEETEQFVLGALIGQKPGLRNFAR